MHTRTAAAQAAPMQTRSAPAQAAPVPQNVSETANLASEVRTAVADLRTRFDTKVAEIERRTTGTLTIEQVRTELAPHAQAVAELQTALTRAGRPQNGREVELETNQRSRAAFAHWLRTGDASKLKALTIGVDAEGKDMSAWQPEMCERASGSSETGPAGGYVVLPEIDRNIQRITDVYSEFGARARNVVIGATEFITFLKERGATLTWMNREGQEAGEADAMTFRPVRIVAHEAQVIPVYPRNLLQDAFFDLNGEVARDIAEATAIGTNSAFFNGDGNGQPRGFVSHATAEQTSPKVEVAVDKIGFIETGSNSGWSAAPGDEADVFKRVQYFIKPQYKAGSTYIFDRMTLSEVALFKDLDGQYLWQPSLIAGQPSQLFAAPIMVADEMPSPAQDKFPVAFGDPNQFYTVVRRAGLEILINPYRNSGLVRFEAYIRVGGAVSKPEAVKFIKQAA